MSEEGGGIWKRGSLTDQAKELECMESKAMSVSVCMGSRAGEAEKAKGRGTGEPRETVLKHHR